MMNGMLRFVGRQDGGFSGRILFLTAKMADSVILVYKIGIILLIIYAKYPADKSGR
jgi:hypothetical protein